MLLICWIYSLAKQTIQDIRGTLGCKPKWLIINQYSCQFFDFEKLIAVIVPHFMAFLSFLYVAYECGCVYTHYMQACVPVLVHTKVNGRLQVFSSVTAGLIPVNLMMAVLVRLARQQAP